MSDTRTINVSEIYIKGLPLLDRKTGKINKIFLPKQANPPQNNYTIFKIFEVYQNDKVKFRFK